jgi:hypothetical protein
LAEGWLNNNHSLYDAALAILSEAEEMARALTDRGPEADVIDLVGVLSYSKELWCSTLETSLDHFKRGLALGREIGVLTLNSS